jgi:hypothetical protein
MHSQQSKASMCPHALNTNRQASLHPCLPPRPQTQHPNNKHIQGGIRPTQTQSFVQTNLSAGPTLKLLLVQLGAHVPSARA